jgi:uncharacterized membrane protein HdeD (DUF308 family)
MATTVSAGATMPAEIGTAEVAALARRWWALALRGAAALLFGVLTFLRPGATLGVLALFFGVYALVDGALYVAAGLRGRSDATDRNRHWGMLLLAGVAGITLGALTLWFPQVTLLLLVQVVAAWAIITGVSEIVAAVRLRSAIRGEWLLGLSGALSALFGVALLVAPAVGAIVLALWLGAYAAAAGVILLVLAVKLRGYAARHAGQVG